VGDLASSSFEFYDGVRILVTGAILVALYTAVIETFALNAPLPTADALSAITAVTLAGVILYFLDVPGRSVLYAAALPHRVLDSWGLTPPGGRTMRNVYFVLMDTRMPAGLRSRAQYYGSMYRIAFETILLLCVSGTLAVTGAGLCTYPRGAVSGKGAQPVMAAGAGAFGFLAVCAIVTALLKATPSESHGRARVVADGLRFQIPWVDRVLLALLAGASAAFALWGGKGLLIGASLVASILWTFRYLRGTLRAERRRAKRTGRLRLAERLTAASRRNVDASTATLLVCFAALAVWVPLSLQSTAHTHLSSAAAVGWTLTVLTGGVLVLCRGHEVKLWGSCHTVGTWLEINREAIAAELGLSGVVPATPRRWWQRRGDGR
jgi:hypothetical protein